MSSVKLSEESFSQLCPEGYLFDCDMYGCRCRKNIWESLKKLSNGTIIGIIVGMVCFLILILLLFVLINRKYNSSSKYGIYGVPWSWFFN